MDICWLDTHGYTQTCTQPTNNNQSTNNKLDLFRFFLLFDLSNISTFSLSLSPKLCFNHLFSILDPTNGGDGSVCFVSDH